jgi:hypothetical protein
VKSKTVKQKEKSTCIILDSNIWVSSLLLRTSIGAALIYYVRQSKGYIILPEIVEQELFKHIIRVGDDARANVEKNTRIIEIIIGSRPNFTLPSREDFEDSVRNRLAELNSLIIRIPLTLAQTKAALVKVNMDLPPNGPKNQQFKDSLIWEAVLKSSKKHVVHFITSDTAFYEGREPRKGLADNLMEEIGKIGGVVYSHFDIATCLKALQVNAPPLNTTEIADAINNISYMNLQSIVLKRSFELQNMISHKVQSFITERANILAIEFTLTYNLIDISNDQSVFRSEPTVSFSGECVYDIEKE